MSFAEWRGVAAVLAVLFAGLPLIRSFTRRCGATPEVARKIVHVAMGLTCVTFPWLFTRPFPVWILAGMATIPLAVVRSLPVLRHGVGSALHGINRPSYGEIFFAPAVAAVFHLAHGNTLLYLIPILILTISDAAGALVGTRWGKLRYGSGEGFKTVEGSTIFLLTAFLCGTVPLLLDGKTDLPHALGIGLILGLLAMMAEGISDRGFDNLLLPLVCFLILEKLMPLGLPALAGRAVVLGLLLVLVFQGSRWSTLSGGALLGAALLGYACAVIADWRFALPPSAVFLCHVATTRKHRLIGKLNHRLDVVLSHVIACLPWVVLPEFGVISTTAALAGISFAMAAQLANLETAIRPAIPDCPASPARSTVKGFVIAGLPGLVWLWPSYRAIAPAIALALPAIWLAALLFGFIRLKYHGHPTGLWVIKGLLALAASAPALMISHELASNLARP